MEMVLKFSNRDLEKRDGFYKAFIDNHGEQKVVSINGIEQPFMVAEVECKPGDYYGGNWLGQQHYDYERTITLVSVEKAKSKQEIEAEEAVEKAKSSLEAAKKVLESLKDC